MSNNSDNKYELRKLKDDLKNSISITDIFEQYFYPVKRKGRTSEALCPFHNDKDYGNFYINEAEGYYKCFSCGSTGDIFSLVQQSTGCGFTDTIWILAKDYGFITAEDYENKKIKFDKDYKLKKQNLKEKRKNENFLELAQLTDENKIALVYDIFRKVSGLKDEDREYLLKFRNIDENRVDIDYFTMPYCTKSFMERLLKELRANGLNEGDLVGVPGFYLSDNKKPLFSGFKGIGIIIKNSKGTRIQIRLHKPFLNKSKKEQRYIWFSSQYKYMGCGSGSPVDVSIPNINKDDLKAIAFLTEGKFKSEKINQHFNSVSLSMQGITSWKDKIKPEIIEVNKSVPIKGIFICYDADMAFNLQVYYQCKEMVKEELDIFHRNNIFMVVWDVALGKGIDDLIDNGHKDKLKKIEFYKYEVIYEAFLSKFKKNKSGEILDENGKIMNKDAIYKEYMKHVFDAI